MTPLEIEILLKSYYSPEPLSMFFNSEAASSAINFFKNAGLLDEEGRITEMGRAHVSQLSRLPFPRQGWVNAHGEIIPVSPC